MTFSEVFAEWWSTIGKNYPNFESRSLSCGCWSLREAAGSKDVILVGVSNRCGETPSRLTALKAFATTGVGVLRPDDPGIDIRDPEAFEKIEKIVKNYAAKGYHCDADRLVN